MMSTLLEMARKKGYRNRWNPVLSHLSVNEMSETGTLEYDFHALVLINFIISGLETVDQRTDERRLLAALKFDESISSLKAAIDERLTAMDVNRGGHPRGKPGHQRRESAVINLQKERLHKLELCQSIGEYISAFNKLRSEDIAELKVEAPRQPPFRGHGISSSVYPQRSPSECTVR